MSGEPSESLPGLPPTKKPPRRGQEEVFQRILAGQADYLNVQLPTGYGKTFAFCRSYAILHAQRRCDRMLVVFPTDAQLLQFKEGAPMNDLPEAGVPEPRTVFDLRFYGTAAVRRHEAGEAQVFAITIQSLIQRGTMELVQRLLSRGRWMVVVDEYHHYGVEKAWGRAVRGLPCAFLMALSATPYRPEDDSAFGEPHIVVKYRDAVEQGAVKELWGHSYVYRIEALTEDGEILQFTTDQLVAEAGGDSPEAIEALRIKRRMRWSPKYVAPLVRIPIERACATKLRTAHPVQVLIGAMCVSHARLVCEQVADMFPHLAVEWVGTGTDGRTEEENRGIIRRFCPRRDASGRASRPTLDVLVHVGMAGEGLDSRYIAEIVHLNAAGVNNTNNQENGRASRRLGDIKAHINFDSSSGYAQDGYIGTKIMDAMDCLPPTEDEEPIDCAAFDPDADPPPLPEDPPIEIWNMELERIDAGDPGVVRMAEAMETIGYAIGGRRIGPEDVKDASSPAAQEIFRLYRLLMQHDADKHNEESVIAQWSDKVQCALHAVARDIVRRVPALQGDSESAKARRGALVRGINRRKKMANGGVSKDIENLRQHWRWLCSLQEQVRAGRAPAWIAAVAGGAWST